MSNRRRSERYRVELPVRLKDAAGGEDTKTADISAHGIAIFTKRMRTLRQYVELEIKLPKEGTEITVTAMVARIIDGLERPGGERERGLGLDFFLFDARAKNEWQSFIQDLRAAELHPTSALPATAQANRQDGQEPASTFLVRPRDLPRLWSFFRREMEKGLVRIETPVPKEVGEPVEILVVHPTTLGEWCLQGRVLRSIERRSGRPVLEIGLVALDEVTRSEFKAFISSGEGMILEDVPISTDVPMEEGALAPAEEPAVAPDKVHVSDLTIPEPPSASAPPAQGSMIIDLEEAVLAAVPPAATRPEDEKTVSLMPNVPRAISLAASARADEARVAEKETEKADNGEEVITDRGGPGYGADPNSLSGKLFSSFFFEAAESQPPKKALQVAPTISSPSNRAAPRVEVKALHTVKAVPAAPPPGSKPTPVLPATPPLPHPTPVLPLIGGAPLRDPSRPHPPQRLASTPTPPPLPPRPSSARGLAPVVRGVSAEPGSPIPDPAPPPKARPTPPPAPPPDPAPPRRPGGRLSIEEASSGAHRTMSTASSDPALDRDIALARARVVRSPNSVTACYRLGTLLLQRGDFLGFGEAINTLQRVMELEPNHPGAHHAVAEAFAKRGDFASAAEHLQKARRLGYQIDPELERAVLSGRRTS